MSNYAGIEDEFAAKEKAAIYLQSIPYDGTSTWGKGADRGFEAFLEASENMELYDIETDSEVYKKGIFILDEIKESRSPELVYQAVKRGTQDLLQQDRFFTFFGGEHAVSIGIIEVFQEKYGETLSVLQLDAHSDLRKEYMGSPYNHACALHQAAQNGHLVQVGIRSMDSSEIPYLKKDNCFFAEDMFQQTDWQEASIQKLKEKVYLTIDLDVFDPGIMPSTGTPEPGGLDWNTCIQYLRKVFKEKEVVGFDIVEFAPIDNFRAPDFLVAKLYYKLISYKFYG